MLHIIEVFWVQYDSGSVENKKHRFFLEELSRIVNGTLRKFVVIIHAVVIVRPMEEGSNFN
jgi:hypothetical protein